MKRSIAIIAVCILLFAMLAACAGRQTEPEEATTEITTETTLETEESTTEAESTPLTGEDSTTAGADQVNATAATTRKSQGSTTTTKKAAGTSFCTAAVLTLAAFVVVVPEFFFVVVVVVLPDFLVVVEINAYIQSKDTKNPNRTGKIVLDSSMKPNNSGWSNQYHISYGHDQLISRLKERVNREIDAGAYWMYCYYDSSDQYFYILYS